jgi:hypothetical protein
MVENWENIMMLLTTAQYLMLAIHTGTKYSSTGRTISILHHHPRQLCVIIILASWQLCVALNKYWSKIHLDKHPQGTLTN